MPYQISFSTAKGPVRAGSRLAWGVCSLRARARRSAWGLKGLASRTRVLGLAGAAVRAAWGVLVLRPLKRSLYFGFASAKTQLVLVLRPLKRSKKNRFCVP